ncbi:peptide ABC transporter substrate-binding protein [Rossellomorea sp. YZS02]|uniref:peptide ABC transporter substrate-binding protein n=1 Tax=Rossellomorea sp. YZS02 TaxID=3097358 RepID=UPI002A16F1C5|nr:peptide ABC transporter substrate-binding protein [Rossellomorea sp. YZS02]MDX8344940.1 peptide ABC transporter substrate-binding protein [Rossellomorea sp. YZS02]
MKVRLFPLVLIFTILLTACSGGENPKDHLGEIYILAMDALMEEDKALNSDMTFIAIDMSDLDGVDEEQKITILRHFKDQYKVETMNATMVELERKGYYDPDTNALEGVLLQIEKVDFTLNDHVLIEGTKFKSGKGAIGLRMEVEHEDGEWKLKESELSGIS